jgi:hypothetical protein
MAGPSPVAALSPLLDSAIVNNLATYGGAISHNPGNLTITGSTLSGNKANQGGAILTETTLNSNQTTITNSTISGNTAYQVGGGIFNGVGRLVITHSTITNNNAPANTGGGVSSRVAGSQVQVGHSIIADNPTGNDVQFIDGASNPFVLQGFNLVEFGNAVSAFGLPGDLVGIGASLAPLADNGGVVLPDGSRVQTHALFDSVATNAGSVLAVAGMNGVPVYDQRGIGFPRIKGDRIDIGAYELQASVPTLPGDYNLDGTVNAADYMIWRDTRGSTIDLRANGDATNNVIDAADYAAWRANFGDASEGAGTSDGNGAGVEARRASVAISGEHGSTAIENGSDTPVRSRIQRSLHGGQECPPHVSDRALALLQLLASPLDRDIDSKAEAWGVKRDPNEDAAREAVFAGFGILAGALRSNPACEVFE